MWRPLIAVSSVILSFVNIALFSVWLSLIRIEADKPPENRQYLLDTLGLSINILEVILAAVGIGLALLSVFGFQEIRASATTRAEIVARETARAVATEEIARALLHQQTQQAAAARTPMRPSVTPQQVDTTGAEREHGS